jgi:two-component system nitrogen regulation sensor histidine kinase NtrY
MVFMARFSGFALITCLLLSFIILFLEHSDFGKNLIKKQYLKYDQSVERQIDKDFLILQKDSIARKKIILFYKNKAYFVQIFEKGKLVYWNNEVLYHTNLSYKNFSPVFLNNKTLIGKAFNLNSKFRIHCFYISKSNNKSYELVNNRSVKFILFILFSLSILFYLFFLRFFISRNINIPYLSRVLLVIFALAILKICLLYFDFPAQYNQFGINNAISFANKFLGNSIFSLLIHTAMLYVFIDVLLYDIKAGFKKNVKQIMPTDYVFYGIIFTAIFLFAIFSKIISIIIFDSDIPLNLIDFTNYSTSNMVFLLVIYLWFWILTKILFFLILSFKITFKQSIKKYIISFVIILLFLKLLFLQHSFYFLLIYSLAIIVFIDVLTRYYHKNNNNYYIIIYYLIVFSVILSANTIYYKKIKEKNSRALIANKFSRIRNPIFELNVDDFSRKIKLNTVLQNAFKNEDEVLILQQLENMFVKQNFENFNYKVYLFDSLNNAVLPNALPLNYFKHKIKNPYFKVNEKTYIVATNNEGFSYLSVDTLAQKKVLIINWSNKELQNSIFPDYGFGYYKNGELLYSSGNNYYNAQRFSLPKFERDTFINYRNNSLFFKKINSIESVVIFKEHERWYDYFSVFSLFFTFSFFLFIFYLLVSLFIRWLTLQVALGSYIFNSLNDKILLSYYTLVLILFLVAGFFNIFIYIQNNNASVKLQMKETQTILSKEFRKIVLNDAVGLEEIQKRMMELGNVIKNPVFLYNPKGELIQAYNYTSNNENLLKYNVYENLMYKKYPQIFVNPSFLNINRTILYTAIHNDITNEVTGFFKIQPIDKNNAIYFNVAFNAFFNVFVILILLGSIIAFFISKALLEPLKNLSYKINMLKLGKSNTKLRYNANDEIGTLVKEYNLMIEKLDESAKKLAASERNLAWNEMAKQVAHEIKNPLTPMKLSLQLLQRAISEESPQAKEMTQRLAITMLEQIDNLTNIANQFSQFAKIKDITLQKYDIVEIVENAVTLFQSEFDGKIIFNKSLDFVELNIDKNQMMQVMNNLLKNAIQAMEHTLDPLLEITISAQSNEVIIAIQDNGVGIQPEDTKDIFEPNFTTKSSGTGLGLPISKKIIENFGGRIYYNASIHKGVVFFVALPLPTTDEVL